SSSRPFTTSERVREIPVTRVATFGHIASTAVSPGMVQAIRAHPADIIHLHWPNPMAVAAYIRSRHPRHLVITYHSDVLRQKALPKAFQPLLDRVLGRAAAVIATSPHYVETSGVLQSVRHKCRAIPLGLHTDPFDLADPVDVARIRSQFGPRILLSVGR